MQVWNESRSPTATSAAIVQSFQTCNPGSRLSDSRQSNIYLMILLSARSASSKLIGILPPIASMATFKTVQYSHAVLCRVFRTSLRCSAFNEGAHTLLLYNWIELTTLLQFLMRPHFPLALKGFRGLLRFHNTV